MNSSSRAFLGVEKSVTNCRWIGPDDIQDRLASVVERQTGLPMAVCRILVRANVAPEESAAYLQPKLRDLMPDPSNLLDMDKAVERFIEALDQQERIAIFADYDVDGACSAAQLIWWLRALGRTATLYVPDRALEGFGPNPTAMRKLAATHSLIICVDCGISAHVALSVVEGADVIVMDHHSGEETLPPAIAVVNPNRQDETSDLTYLCAAGVVFMFLVALNRKLTTRKDIKLCNLKTLLDLVALATVADVSPLIALNRAFVRSGLQVMRSRSRPGLKALADTSKLNSPPTSYHLGFVLGPRINAAGRIGASGIGAKLLASNDPLAAQQLAEQLEQLNSDRKDMVETATAEALKSIESNASNQPLVWAASESWHPGIVGIIAARLVEATGRPAIAISIGANSSKGSSRSVTGVDIGAAVLRCKNEGLLIGGGGHKMAAGLEVETNKIEAAMLRLSEMIAHLGVNINRSPGLKVSGVLQPEAVTIELFDLLEQAGPFGPSAPAPRFVLPNVRVSYHRWIKGQHLQLKLRGETGSQLEAIAFRADQSPLGEFLVSCGSIPLYVAGRLQADHFKGKVKVKLQVVDAAPA